MRGRISPVEALVTLPQLSDPAERRANWRQAIAALGIDVRVKGPPPLDGVEPDDLSRAAQSALEFGLADDLDWIAPASAALALFEVTAALPAGREKRELGRRVLSRVYEGTAATFAAVAARMALGSVKLLDGATMRARIALVVDLPIGSGVNADALAFALVARRELSERWVTAAASGPLAARRLAARLLERAAREAVTRTQQGDPHARELLLTEPIRTSFDQLLNDREPLVWRHAAVARGLIAGVDPMQRDKIELALDPGLSPTEWRRGAVSLAALLVADPAGTMKQCRALLEGDVARKDPGVAATLVYGLPPVVEAEPDAAEELLEQLSRLRRADVAEAVATLLGDLTHANFAAGAVSSLKQQMAELAEEATATSGLLARQALSQLERQRLDDTIHEGVRRSMVAFETSGARAAQELAVEALGTAHRVLDRILELDQAGEAAVPELLQQLGDLDASVLERSRLSDLILLGRRPGDTDASVPEMERLYDRVGSWVLERQMPSASGPSAGITSLTDQRQLRGLLHLVDLETVDSEADGVAERVRARVRRAISSLIDRIESGPDAAVHRILCAALARSFDAAVREGVAEASDLLLLSAHSVSDRHSIGAIAEASTHPEVLGPLSAYADFMGWQGRDLETDHFESLPVIHSVRPDATVDAPTLARRMLRLSQRLGTGGTYRGEALRQSFVRMGRALEQIASARGQSEIGESSSSGGSSPLLELEASANNLRQLIAGSRRRVLGQDPVAAISVVADVPPLSALVDRAISAGVPANSRQMAMAVGELCADLPPALVAVVGRIAGRIEKLPVSPPNDAVAIPLERRRNALPDWLLPRRTIGAFYVVRALGSGGTSTVFVARRLEDRHDGNAESFALKVPEYDPSTARSLSEQEFFQLFREEASALLGMPQQENLARFVTFDLAARPKPILVMELIRGLSMDRLIRSRSLTLDRALHYLCGVLSGLQAMHGAGVGHLDVKPSNVILKDGQVPVLVDFGLSGRHLRPGCGTVEYCAPEVLGVVPEGLTPQPTPADLYAFACMAFELLTTEPLFDAPDETAMITQHVSHDGWPNKLVTLAKNPALKDLCVVIAACLRRDPRNRPTASETQAALSQLRAPLAATSWPLAPRAA